MDRAKEAKQAQQILAVVLAVFLAGMVVQFFAPNEAALRDEVEKLKGDVRIQRARVSQTSTCPVNADCQRRLKALKQNNWVMENDSLRNRIIDLQKAIASCSAERRTDGDACAESQAKATNDHKDKKRQLDLQLQALQRDLRLIKQQHDSLAEPAPAPAPIPKPEDPEMRNLLNKVQSISVNL